KDPARLQEVQASGIDYCWIDVSKGLDIPAQVLPQEAAKGEPPSAKQSPPKREPVSLTGELQHAARIRARSLAPMRPLFTEVRLGNAIEAGSGVALVDEVVESVDRHPHALLSLARLKNADEYTYVHSVAVCALMVALGRQLGLNDTQCREAGMAGMFH